MHLYHGRTKFLDLYMFNKMRSLNLLYLKETKTKYKQELLM